jgi:solute:Na+ symporter, SSS family
MVPACSGSAGGSDHYVLLVNRSLSMNYFDWIVLIGTILFIVAYGTIKTRSTSNINGYLRADNSMKWWMIGISIMATQASAVTFLSTPGQAMEDGMRFLQFYFGLPIAMVIISVTIVPIYYKLKVFTAYEYLETRFDLKSRILAAILFLMLRGLSVGITLFAPSLVLSTILQWPITLTTFVIGVLVIIYVVSGGSKAVSLTQRYQMAVIMSGMILAGILAFALLPKNVSFLNTVQIAGTLGKLNLVNLNFDPSDRYNIWSGLIAGTFLFLSYFGTDQSQVARYLGGSSVAESRMGLLFNGLLKIPMQFVILFIGILVYVFYLFNAQPVYHNKVLLEKAKATEKASQISEIETAYDSIHEQKRSEALELVDAIRDEKDEDIARLKTKLLSGEQQEKDLRDSLKQAIAVAIPGAITQDRDYMFLNFVLGNLPHGVIGLLMAVIFSAAMSSMAGELNALASTTTVDIYKRTLKHDGNDQHYLIASRWFTILWAVIGMIFATLAGFSENLIQYVNIVGSLFYGTLLGIFLSAFYIRFIQGTAVFIAAVITQLFIFYLYLYTDIAFLLYNLIGPISVIALAIVTQFFLKARD